jgi:hypothetical protein
VTDQEIVVESSERAIAIVDVEHELRLGDQHVASYRDVLNRAAEISSDLSHIIKQRQLSKRIGPKEFVYVEGWTTCGAMLGVAIRPVSCDENPTCEGEFVAMVEAVRTSDGFVLGRGIASCGPDERDWKSRSRQARRSMAQTRAAGKAMRLLFSWIMEMAGFAATPFEEMEGCSADQHENPVGDETLPQEKPRAKRQAPPPAATEVSTDQLGHVTAVWKSKHPDPDGNLMRQRAAFSDWVREVAGRKFNPSKMAEWKKDDYVSCCRALNIEAEGVE